MSRDSHVVVREATVDDLPRLHELLVQLSQLGERPEQTRTTVTDAERAALQLLSDSRQTACLVVEAEGQVQGTLTVYLLANLSHGGRPMGIIENLVVDESCRGRGFGRRLMQAAEERLFAAGCYKIGLTSNRRRTDAHRFYERLGYKPTHQGYTVYLI
jgi:GNAT superfamily N-acetyltransferase